GSCAQPSPRSLIILDTPRTNKLASSLPVLVHAKTKPQNQCPTVRRGEERIEMSSLYEKIGGEAAVDAAVDVFYRKVLADDRISRFFDDIDMDRQRVKQKAFLTFAFGGPANYSGKDMRSAHAKMNLSEEDFNAVMENLGGTL